MLPSLKPDIVVLGAGIVGVGAALHLQARGRDVVLVDRLGVVAGETSFGNTGIVQAEAVFPYAFPRRLGDIVRAARNADPRAQLRYSALPAISPWLWRYFRASAPAPRTASARALRPLVAQSVAEHEKLAAAAGAGALLRRGGWIKAFRSERGRRIVLRDLDDVRPYGVVAEVLDRTRLAVLEPHLTEVVAGGVHFIDPLTTSDPAALTEAYAALFVSRGGRLLAGDARSLEAADSGWALTTREGPLQAREAVIALGAWSSDVYGPLGYRFPLGVKRGYHMHYDAARGAILSRPVLDAEFGYVLTPMSRGIRLTTGAEFARRDDPPSPAHLDRLEPLARALFPLAARRDPAPWLGRRPCLPDMLPMIGAAPRHKGLWFDFGHHHLGLTLGPVSGRLLAELMTGEAPLTDPAPYRPGRF